MSEIQRSLQDLQNDMQPDANGVTLMPDQYKPGQPVGQFNVEDVIEDPFNGAKRYRLILNGANVSSWSILAKKGFDWNRLKGHSIALTRANEAAKFRVTVLA